VRYRVSIGGIGNHNNNNNNNNNNKAKHLSRQSAIPDERPQASLSFITSSCIDNITSAFLSGGSFKAFIIPTCRTPCLNEAKHTQYNYTAPS